MSALHHTRRRLLGGVITSVATVLAGCYGESDDRTEIEQEASDRRTEPPPEATLDYRVRSLRAPVEEPFVGFGQGESERPRHRSREFVLSEERAAAIEFEVEHEDTEAIRNFLEETDYESASVVVHQRSIEACYTRRVEYVTVQEDRYYARFCRRLKPATERCEADETEMEALFIRVPRAYESAPSSRGSGERSRCSSDYWDGGRNA